ncbi:MAG: hypothetical protein Q8R29_00770 [bacterium]|nr:hypothetical protein [bacterium]
MTSTEIFNELKSSSAYNPAVPENLKLRLLGESWEEIVGLTRCFRPDGTITRTFRDKKDLVNGFGHFVEVIAKHDPDIPKNSAKADYLANMITDFLKYRHIGNNGITLNGFSRVPDFVWIDFSGRRANIWGLGEVKASVSAYADHIDQVAEMEGTLLGAVRDLEEQKQLHPYLSKLKLVVNPLNLKKILITPSGCASSMIAPSEWEHRELHFTGDELMFIAQKFWPKFRSWVSFQDNMLGRYRTGFLDTFLKWGTKKLLPVFLARVLQHNTLRLSPELFLFAVATMKLPLIQRDVCMVIDKIRPVFQMIHKYPEKVLTVEELGSWERHFLTSFSYVFKMIEEVEQQILLFLTNLRGLSTTLVKICRSEPELEEIIKRAIDFDLNSVRYSCCCSCV